MDITLWDCNILGSKRAHSPPFRLLNACLLLSIISPRAPRRPVSSRGPRIPPSYLGFWLAGPSSLSVVFIVFLCLISAIRAPDVGLLGLSVFCALCPVSLYIQALVRLPRLSISSIMSSPHGTSLCPLCTVYNFFLIFIC